MVWPSEGECISLNLETVALLVLIFILGTAFGSFLNQIIYRAPQGISFFLPRSFCPHCKRTIDANHNIPVISYFHLRGRCAECRHPIPIHYPIVEFLGGVAAVVITLLWL